MKLKIVLSLLAASTLFSSARAEEVSSTDFFAQEEALQVHIKPYNAEESKLYLSKDLLDRGVQPFEITIDNPTPNKFYLAEMPVNLQTLSAKKVAFKVSKSAIPRSIAYKIASLFFWPIAIPGTIDSIRTLKKHRSMTRDFSAKTLKADESVSQYSTLHRIVFVNTSDYVEPLEVTLIDQKTQEVLTFQEEVADVELEDEEALDRDEESEDEIVDVELDEEEALDPELEQEEPIASLG